MASSGFPASTLTRIEACAQSAFAAAAMHEPTWADLCWLWANGRRDGPKHVALGISHRLTPNCLTWLTKRVTPVAVTCLESARTERIRTLLAACGVGSTSDPSVEKSHMAELIVDFIASLDGYAAADGWPGWWEKEGPEYLDWLGKQPEANYTVLMGANTYRLMSGLANEGEPGPASSRSCRRCCSRAS